MNNEDWKKTAKELRAQGSLEKTLHFLNDLSSANPKDPSIYYQIAWTHDALGKEADAVPAYEKAIALGLAADEIEGAYLGLGSTYRALGDYNNSKRVFQEGIARFPNNGALKVFYALTLHNLKDHAKAMETLIQELVRSTSDETTKAYGRALLYYSDKLEQTFE